MEKNRILEINIELPLTSLTLFSSLLKLTGSVAIWATCLINFNAIFSGWCSWKKQNKMVNIDIWLSFLYAASLMFWQSTCYSSFQKTWEIILNLTVLQ